MILRYVSRVLVCKLHPSRVAQRPLFPAGRFNNKSTLSRPLFSSASAFSFPFLFFSPSFVPVVAEKAFHGAVENALHGTRHSRPIILCNIHADVITGRSIFASAVYYVRHFTAISLNYGLITGRQIIKKLSQSLSAPQVVKKELPRFKSDQSW